MASENYFQPSIPRFDGHHYDYWSMLMENFLRSKEYWTVVEASVLEPATSANDAQRAEIEKEKLKDLKAKNYLFQAIDRAILETILNKSTSKTIWDSMKKKYRGNERDDGYCKQDDGENLDDVAIVEKILRFMTTKFNYVVYSIEGSNDIETLSLDELQNLLLVHEWKINCQDKLEGSSATEYQKRWQNRNCQAVDNRSKSAGKASVDCFRCHKYSHYRSECHANLNRGENSNFVEHNVRNDDASLFMVCHPKEVNKKNVWYLDTGCNNHMCGDKSAFSDLDESFQDKVKFGDNSTIVVKGKGKSNLFSLGQLQEKGYEIMIKDGVCQVRDSKLGLIAKVKMTENRLFPLYLQTTNLSCLFARLKDIAWLWHCQYGHIYFGGLKALQQKEMVNGLPHFDSLSKICEICMVSKQHRNSFPKDRSWRAKWVLDLVHSDLCGPINPTSNGGKQYFITFVDDYNRKTLVYFLQTKSEALAVFKKFKVLVENEAGKSVKVLRTDHGGEFNSKEFADFCETNGIKRQLTAAYTPQSPTSPLPNMTLEEAWSGRKPTVDYFRIFGCIAYAHVPNQKRSKLDDKEEKCIFLGVSDQSKAYRLYNPITKKNSKGQTQQTGGLTSADLEVSRQTTEESLNCDLLTYEEAIKEEKRQKAMAEEIDSIERNQTWELTDLLEGHKTIGVKWIYKTKLKENGEVT
ncbi:hypothetical protein SLEP1_g45065 [Rubroshorea leprosula]|uniref:Integrase catalytic domain-containing protein n=1 Tax=Rubroshorea leprosula TaxID=152421 RepID=A0AAV5LIM5_9ROSI|nr:hypothetical protein SLEP1_g45065 [Rubroshorea leprosula]